MSIVRKAPIIKVVLDTNAYISAIVIPRQTLSVINKDRDDNRILECAVESKAQYIISGDKRHLLPLKEHQGIKILLPAEFLKTISLTHNTSKKRTQFL